MEGEWKIFSTPIGGEKYYRVGRKLRDNEPLHSGNVEYIGGLFINKSDAEELKKQVEAAEKEQEDEP